MPAKNDDYTKLHILRRVSSEAAWGVLDHCPVRSVGKGEILLEKGQTNQAMYLLLDGTLTVHLETADSEPVAVLERGETVGEISVLDDAPVSAWVRASEDARLLVVDEEDFWRLVEASHELATNLLLLMAERMRATNTEVLESVIRRRTLEHEATVDALTGLRNRRWLDQSLPRLVSRHQAGKQPLAVAMIDIDHFKRFNDHFGHAAGDRVLSSVGKAIRSRLRPTDLGARYGGEELVVILPGTGPWGAGRAAERLRLVVEQTEVSTGDGRVLPPVTVSIGVSGLLPEDEPAELLARADAALYRAKDAGRNRVETG